MKQLMCRLAVGILFLSATLMQPRPAMAACEYCDYISWVGYECANAVGRAGNTDCVTGDFGCHAFGTYCMYSGGNYCFEDSYGGIVCIDQDNQ